MFLASVVEQSATLDIADKRKERRNEEIKP
jgi:hypothetical protein